MAHSGAEDSGTTPSRSPDLIQPDEWRERSAFARGIDWVRAVFRARDCGSAPGRRHPPFDRLADILDEAYANLFHRVDLTALDPHRREALEMALRGSIDARVREHTRPRDANGDSDQSTPSFVAALSAAHAGAEQTTPARQRAAFARLNHADQQLIVARLVLRCSYDQIALVTGRSSAEAAHTATRSALLRLAEEMSSIEE
jgi:DNA-directed RNA polymerase specialized sigma24 family protein